MAKDKKNKLIKVAFVILGIIITALIFNKILDEWKGFRAVVNTITGAAAPIVVGFVIAFLMNPVLVFFDRLFHTLFQDKIIKDDKKLFKVSRTLSVILTTLVFLGIISGLLRMVLPQLYESIKLLIDSMDTYYQNILKMIDNVYGKFRKLNISEEEITSIVNKLYEKMQTWANDEVLPNMDKIVINISTGVVGGLKFLYNFLLGIVASIYVMANKEYLASRCKKVIYAFFNVKNANLFLDGMDVVNRVFSQFINGKILDSLIIGVMLFIITTIIDMPYAILISVIVGVTNIIPFFGPIIGAIPCVFIVLIADPFMGLLLAIIILLLQQFDGNILGPKILGDVTGLSSFWVLAAVIVGGGIFGFSGMLLGVPVFACCYMYINRTCTNKLNEKKLISISSEFERIKRFNPETGEPIYKTEEELDIRFKKKTPEEKALQKHRKKKKKKDTENQQDDIVTAQEQFAAAKDEEKQ